MAFVPASIFTLTETTHANDDYARGIADVGLFFDFATVADADAALLVRVAGIVPVMGTSVLDIRIFMR